MSNLGFWFHGSPFFDKSQWQKTGKILVNMEYSPLYMIRKSSYICIQVVGSVDSVLRGLYLEEGLVALRDVQPHKDANDAHEGKRNGSDSGDEVAQEQNEGSDKADGGDNAEYGGDSFFHAENSFRWKQYCLFSQKGRSFDLSASYPKICLFSMAKNSENTYIYYL